MSDSRIAITGTGICTAIGDTPKAITDSLMLGRSGIAEFLGDGKEAMNSRLASVHRTFKLDGRFPAALRRLWDRATQMAAMAAADAVGNSMILKSGIGRDRIGMAVGVSGAAQFSPNKDLSYSIDAITSDMAELLVRRNVPQYQLYQLARWLQLTGPQTCLCSASAGSGIAIGNGIRWLLSDQADAVIAGGGEAIMLLNFLGFDTLGLLSQNVCSPFSGCDGMNMGEGAGFVVLERYEDAIKRKANIRGVLLGFGVTSDAFDQIQFDPSGDGIRRAMDSAIKDADIHVSDVEWIRASGAGGREQDSSEVMAIRSLFGKDIPLVTSTEANFGHCNGAGPAIGIVAAVETQRLGFIPPTVHFEESSFPGIDFVPNIARKQTAKTYLSTTAAFGGTNVVLVGSASGRTVAPRPVDDVVVSGIAVVSGLGCLDSSFADHLSGVQSLIGPIDRAETAIEGYSNAALVKHFSFRQEAPSVPARGLDLTTQYAIAAAIKARAEAERCGAKFEGARLGVVTGIVNTSGNALEKLLQEIRGPWATPKIGRALLNKGRFLVTSRLAKLLNCKGYNATHTGGIGCGQFALNQACEQLRQSVDTDAILVVATDEVTRIQLKLASMLGWLANDRERMLPYSTESGGMVLGEGAVAIVLERRSSVDQRGGKPLAEIAGLANSLDAVEFNESGRYARGRCMNLAEDGAGLQHAMQAALRRSNRKAHEVDLVLGSGVGIPELDMREIAAVHSVFSDKIPYGSSSSLTGAMCSSGSLFNLCLAVAAMNSDSAAKQIDASVLLKNRDALKSRLNSIALIATSEDGHNVSTIIRRAKTDKPET